MKLLFAHDHIFYSFQNKMYSTGGLSKEMLERYTKIFSNVRVVSRQRAIGQESNLTLATTDNVEFVKIPNFKSIKKYYLIHEAKKIIEKEIEDCDVLIARLPSSIGEIAVKYAKKNNKPYLIELVACTWDALWNHSLAGKMIAPISFIKTRQLVQYAQFVVYVTNKFLQKRYPTKGKSVNCSNVVVTEFDDSILKKRIKKISELKSNSKIIIGTTAAVNVRYKGQQYVIQALGKLKKEGFTNYEYHLVGNGDQSYLRDIAEKYNVINQVKFLGPLPHKEVFAWLDTIDIYVQPSRQEGLPRALIEAMSRAVPAFGAKTAGIPELLEEEFLFSNTKNNINEICNILIKLTGEKMNLQANRNFEEAKKYSNDIIEQRRLKFLKEFKKQS